ncbi:uncharacterized protein [Nicotiana sylvestris]|uniref:uncharacterized protein n=1 Tax=Nicotiana sylvestris TaxID=4096 RepID=UPI00388C4ED2
MIEYPVVTWLDVHHRYQSKIRVEDDQLGAPSGSVHHNILVVKTLRDTDRELRSNKERYQPYVDHRNNGSGHNAPRNDRRNDRSQSSRGLMSKNGLDKHTDPVEAPRLSEYNFSVDASGIVSAIGRVKDTRWPRLIQTDPSQRNPNLMCKYRGTHGPRTEDCRQLREEVARLFNEGHIREFPSDRAKNHFRKRDANRKNEQEEPQHVIHMIIGGVDVPQGPVFKRTKVSVIREKRTRSYVLKSILSFNGEEGEGISQPHNDALVISILLNKIQVKRVLVDPGSSANIIRSRVIEQLGLQDQMVTVSRVLNGFNMASETTKGEIILLVNVVRIIHDTKFLVIEGDMRYNALLGRPWIHNIRAVPSTIHQKMKFPTVDGVKMVYGEQHTIKKMFAVEEVIAVPTPSTSEKPSTKDKQTAK